MYFFIFVFIVIIIVYFTERHHVKKNFALLEKIAILNIKIRFIDKLFLIARSPAKKMFNVQLSPKNSDQILETIKEYFFFDDILFYGVIADNKYFQLKTSVIDEKSIIASYIQSHEVDIIHSMQNNRIITRIIDINDGNSKMVLYIANFIPNTNLNKNSRSKIFTICTKIYDVLTREELILLCQEELMLLNIALEALYISMNY